MKLINSIKKSNYFLETLLEYFLFRISFNHQIIGLYTIFNFSSLLFPSLDFSFLSSKPFLQCVLCDQHFVKHSLSWSAHICGLDKCIKQSGFTGNLIKLYLQQDQIISLKYMWFFSFGYKEIRSTDTLKWHRKDRRCHCLESTTHSKAHTEVGKSGFTVVSPWNKSYICIIIHSFLYSLFVFQIQL